MITNFAFSGPESYNSANMKPIAHKNHKAKGGLWLSKLLDSGETVWEQYVRENRLEGYEKNSFWIDRLKYRSYINISDEANILYLNSIADIDNMKARYFFDIDWTKPDWSVIANDYDGLYMSQKTIDESRKQWRHVFNDKRHFGLWDIESLLMFDSKYANMVSSVSI